VEILRFHAGKWSLSEARAEAIETAEEQAMALFSKEPEKDPKVRPTQASGIANSQPRSTAPSEPLASSTVLKPTTTSVAEELAHLGRGSRVSGKIAFEGSVRIDGEVEGEITVEHTLNIGQTATIAASIRATTIIVAGEVRGDITGQRIEVRPSAKITGNLSAPTLVIHEGARFEGHCAMPGTVRQGEKVTVIPNEERVAPVAQATSADGQKQVSATNSRGSST
jgi:cytoskeletal protein CcmA (bactofilin family)